MTAPPPEVAACGVCGSPSGDGANLCRLHTSTLTDTLATVRDLVDDLEVTVTRQDRIALERTAGRSATTPLVWNEHAAQRAHELNATLNAWALDTSRIRQDERDLLADQHHSDTAGVADWLRRNLSTLRQHPDAGQAHDEILDSVRAARRATDRPANATQFYAGPCPEQIEHEDDGSLIEAPCNGEVWAFIPIEVDKLACLRCQACGGYWDTTQWLRVGRRMLVRIDQLRHAA